MGGGGGGGMQEGAHGADGQDGIDNRCATQLRMKKVFRDDSSIVAILPVPPTLSAGGASILSVGVGATTHRAAIVDQAGRVALVRFAGEFI